MAKDNQIMVIFGHFPIFIISSIFAIFMVAHIFKTNEKNGFELLMHSRITRNKIFLSKLIVLGLITSIYILLMFIVYLIAGKVSGIGLVDATSFLVGSIILMPLISSFSILIAIIVKRSSILMVSTIIPVCLLPVFSYSVQVVTNAFQEPQDIDQQNIFKKIDISQNLSNVGPLFENIYPVDYLLKKDKKDAKKLYQYFAPWDLWYQWGGLYNLTNPVAEKEQEPLRMDSLYEELKSQPDSFVLTTSFLDGKNQPVEQDFMQYTSQIDLQYLSWKDMHPRLNSLEFFKKDFLPIFDNSVQISDPVKIAIKSAMESHQLSVSTKICILDALFSSTDSSDNGKYEFPKDPIELDEAFVRIGVDWHKTNNSFEEHVVETSYRCTRNELRVSLIPTMLQTIIEKDSAVKIMKQMSTDDLNSMKSLKPINEPIEIYRPKPWISKKVTIPVWILFSFVISIAAVICYQRRDVK